MLALFGWCIIQGFVGVVFIYALLVAWGGALWSGWDWKRSDEQILACIILAIGCLNCYVWTFKPFTIVFTG